MGCFHIDLGRQSPLVRTYWECCLGGALALSAPWRVGYVAIVPRWWDALHLNKNKTEKTYKCLVKSWKLLYTKHLGLHLMERIKIKVLTWQNKCLS